MQFIRNMKLGQKLTLTVAVLLVPVAVLGFFFWQNVQGDTRFSQKELDGATYYHPLEEIVSAIQSRNLLVSEMLTESGVNASGMTSIDARIDESFAEVEESSARFDKPNSPSSKLLQETQSLWQNLKTQKFTDGRIAEAAHSDVAAKALETRAQIATDWNITLDPELISYSLLDVAVMRVPDFEHQIGHYLTSAFAAGHDRALDREEDHALTAARTTMMNSWSAILGDLSSVAASGPEGAGLSAKYGPAQAKVEAALKNVTSLIDQTVQSSSQVTLKPSDLNDRAKNLVEAVDELHDAVQDPAIAAVKARHDHLVNSRNFVLSVVAVAVALAVGLALLVSRLLTGTMSKAVSVFERISAGQLDSDIPTDGRDEAGRVLANLAEMQAKLKRQIEADKAAAAEVGRIKQALDFVSAPVMLADAEGTILYGNHATNKMLREHEADFRKSLPQFNAEKIIGSSMDVFHRDPSHQRRLLSSLVSTHRAIVNIGSRVVQIVASPVRGDSGERLGTVVEWIDRTNEVQVEKEVEAVIAAATAGRLSDRIALDGKTGFYEKLAKGFNEILGVSEAVLTDLERVFSALSEGRMTETITADYQGIYGKIKQDTNATVAKLIEIIQQIQMTADLVNSGAIELSRGNQNLSQRTEEQASSLEETASSMEQITSTVKNNADNSSQANQLAAAAGSVAQKGGEVVSRAVTAMGEINESSRRIAAITNVIDEIAFQTNLLALNAAVEAARAGEQGRGFAVVASEVRNLASRSATAAKEIKQLIEDSVKKVDDGSRLVDESGKTLGEIVLGVKKVTDLVGEISAASREQSAGIEEINKAVMQMDEMTQQNAALVEQAAAATEALTEQAQSLSQLTSFFVIDGNGTRRTAVPPRAQFGPATPGKASRPARQGPTPSPGSVRQATGTDGDDWEQF